MSVRDISRTAIGSYLRLVRIPVDAVIDRLPGNGTGPAPAARLVADRAEASVRAALASLLGDPELRQDAQQRASAADKREQAMRLREQADRTTEEADDRLAEREAQAERRRQRARQRTRTQREQAEQQRQESTKRAVAAERKRLDASRTATAQTEQAVQSARPSNDSRRLTRRPSRSRKRSRR